MCSTFPKSIAPSRTKCTVNFLQVAMVHLRLPLLANLRAPQSLRVLALGAWTRLLGLWQALLVQGLAEQQPGAQALPRGLLHVTLLQLQGQPPAWPQPRWLPWLGAERTLLLGRLVRQPGRRQQLPSEKALLAAGQEPAQHSSSTTVGTTSFAMRL